jgi:hypothetical protein
METIATTPRISQEIFNTILTQAYNNENTYNDISAVEFSYKTYKVDFYTYDLNNFTPSIDNFGRTTKTGEWLQYEPTQEQIEMMRKVLKENFIGWIKENENNETGLCEADYDHVASLWNNR